MKKFTKLLAVACALTCTATFAGAFAGCEDDELNDPSVIKMLVHVSNSSTEGKAYEDRIKAFNEAHKEEGIKISCQYKPRTTGAGDYAQVLRGMKTEGTLPDIITFDSPLCASLAKGEFLYDISSLVSAEEQSKFITTSLNKYDGKLYGLPIQEASAGIYYNKALLKAKGVTDEDIARYSSLDSIWTYDDLLTLCAKLKAGASGPVINMRIADTGDETAPFLLYPFGYANGGEYTDSNGLTATGYFDSSQVAGGLGILKTMIDNGYTNYTVKDSNFFAGDVPLFLSAGWTIGDITGKYTGAGSEYTFHSRDDWGVFPYPKYNATATRAYSATGSWSFGVTDNGRSDKSNVIKALLWMTNADSAKVITTATKMIPARTDVTLSSYTPGSAEKLLFDQLQLNGKARPATVAYAEFSTQFNKVIHDMGSKSISELLTSGASSIQTEMNKYKK